MSPEFEYALRETIANHTSRSGRDFELNRREEEGITYEVVYPTNDRGALPGVDYDRLGSALSARPYITAKTIEFSEDGMTGTFRFPTSALYPNAHFEQVDFALVLRC